MTHSEANGNYQKSFNKPGTSESKSTKHLFVSFFGVGRAKRNFELLHNPWHNPLSFQREREREEYLAGDGVAGPTFRDLEFPVFICLNSRLEWKSPEASVLSN